MESKMRVLVLFAALLIAVSGCRAQDRRPEDIVSGVWYWAERKQIATWGEEWTFSWGRSRTIPNATLLIDALAPPTDRWMVSPWIGGPFKIVSIDKGEDSLYRMRIYFDRGKFEVEFRIRYDTAKDTIEFVSETHYDVPRGTEQKKGRFMQLGSVWYRVGGPGI
jgi:hypothetical protein